MFHACSNRFVCDRWYTKNYPSTIGNVKLFHVKQFIGKTCLFHVKQKNGKLRMQGEGGIG